MQRGEQGAESHQDNQDIKQAILDEIRLAGLPFDDIPALLRDDAIASQLSASAQEKLAIRGIDIDSLELVETVMAIIEGPWFGVGDDDEGGGNVREPRRPLPFAGFGAVAIELPQDNQTN